MCCPIRTASQKLKLGLCFVLVSHVVASGDSKRGGGGSHCFTYSAVNCHCVWRRRRRRADQMAGSTPPYLCLELLVRAAFAIVVGVRASTINDKFHSIRLATSRSELLHSAVVLSSICAQKTSGALPAIHPSRGSCQNLPCTTKVSRIPRGRVAHVLVDTERKRECVSGNMLSTGPVSLVITKKTCPKAPNLFSPTYMYLLPVCGHPRTPKATDKSAAACSC